MTWKRNRAAIALLPFALAAGLWLSGCGSDSPAGSPDSSATVSSEVIATVVAPRVSRTASPADLGGATILRVYQDEPGVVTALFDRPVRVEGGDIRLITNLGYADRVRDTDPGGYSYSLRFDVGSLGKGDLTIGSLYIGRGARLVATDQ